MGARGTVLILREQWEMRRSCSKARSTPGRIDGAGLRTRMEGFDFSLAMRRLCQDVVARLEVQLGHIQLDRVAIGFAQARTGCSHGLQASLTPMRFEGGARETTQRGKRWTVARFVDPQGREYLYLLRFYMPRFQNLPLEEKLVTVLHELWHISPRFDGDLRRFTGRCYAHSRSCRDYDQEMQKLVRQWLATSPAPEVQDFLRLDFAGLRRRFGKVYGVRIPTPRLIALD